MTQSANEVLCRECEEPIPAQRLKVIRTDICVSCMEDLESRGVGTPRYRMEIDSVVNKEGSVEEVSFRLIKPKS